MTLQAKDLIDDLIKQKGTDLHLAADNPPMVRLCGQLAATRGSETLSAEDVEALVTQVIGDESFSKLARCGDLDAAFSHEGGYRLRINVYRQRDTLAAAIRLLPNEFFTFEQLGLPLVVLEAICKLHAGLVLVTGATSSGKSTTIASLVNRINGERPCHIHTIEDPIEYLHKSKKGYVTQREVGRDTDSFAEALRRSMREDPDVIVVGEMRDMDTMSAALTLAETGHLTFATLHTASAAQTISRLISAYPAAQQPQTRIQLSGVLQYIICQKLIPWDNGRGQTLAAEVLAATPAVRALIREDKTHQLKNAMQTNYEAGMRTLNQSLDYLVQKQFISKETALRYSEDKQEYLSRGGAR